MLTHTSPASTQLTYGSVLNLYIAFCERHAFPIEPTTDTVLFFVAYMSTYIQPLSVASYLLGVMKNLKPFFPHAQELHAHCIVKDVLCGAEQLSNHTIQRKPPFTLAHLTQLQQPLTPHATYNERLLSP